MQLREGIVMKITPLEIDAARRVFHVVGADGQGRVVVRKKLMCQCEH
ncbi:MAG: hypothetical protein V3T65_08155 [Acidobacteriota bacterium]